MIDRFIACVSLWNMVSSLKTNEKLLSEALELGHFRTKKETVNQALAEFVQYRKQLQMLDWQGRVEFFKDYDYKKLRNSGWN